MDRRYRDCLKLNGKLAALALTNRWIGPENVKTSYNGLADGYAENWLNHLSPVTAHLLEVVPQADRNRIIDLGCGTGYTTRLLAAAHPDAEILAQDISDGMLNKARETASGPKIRFSCSDMLDFMKAEQSCSADLVVSAWAIGYSKPTEIIRESFRVLRPGGHFAFVVNLADTLRPVYVAFRKTMQLHSKELQALALPRFPSSRKKTEALARRTGFKTVFSENKEVKICEARAATLDWLLRTGILAGFDAMLPLKNNTEVAENFERFLQEQDAPITHRYILTVLEKPD